MITIDLVIPAEVQRALSADIRRAVAVAAVAIAAEIQDKIAPYPPTRSGQRYIRGYGMPGRKKTSQMLGRRWGIEKRSDGATLYNTASYAPVVHSHEDQTWMHKGRWTTDKQAVEKVVQSGVVGDILGDALKDVL